MNTSKGDRETFLAAYVECALWSSTDQSDDSGGNPLDDNYSPDDMATEGLMRMARECDEFISANASDLEGIEPEQAGHDFWLTRNGHGAGFWDRGLGDIGERLTEASKPYGESYLYIGDDGAIHVS